jgi:prepilin-type processing-associated H-X9-DG protein
MNTQDMLDHALGRLESPDRERAEIEITSDLAMAEKFDRLSRAIHQLLDDGPIDEPPPGLASRTVLAIVEAHRARRSILDFAPVRVPFRWADVAVAASILLAGLLTLVPAVQKSRQQMDQAGCVFNLQQVGFGLTQYAQQHHVYPYANRDCPAADAGSFAAMLHEAGLLPDLSILDCPSNGPSPAAKSLPDMKTLGVIRKTDPAHYQRLVSRDYAYHVGYLDHNGKPGPIPVSRASERLPLLADQPAFEDHHILEGNSPNHHGLGQNVVFADGHVGWFNSRQIGPQDPDIFLNAKSEPGPGVSQQDSVLLPAIFPFAGR